MIRLNVDTATKEVRQFVRNLPVAVDGIELEMDGKVVCEILPPSTVTPAERAALVARARAISARTRSRTKGISSRSIERTVKDAVDHVRGRKSR